MSALVIIAIAVGAIVLLVILLGLAKRNRRAKLEEKRELAGAHRDEARTRHTEATKQQAAAEESAARARREAAEAEERSRQAAEQRDAAKAHAEHARDLDPAADSEADQTGADTSPRSSTRR